MYNLQRIRKKKGLSQAQLAKKAGISEISIRKYESGERKPKIETISKIAMALDIPVEELFDGYFEDYDEVRKSLKIPPGKIALTVDDNENKTMFVDPIEFQRSFNNVVHKCVPNPVSFLLNEFYKLSPIGQDVAIKQVKMLTKIPEYQKQEKPDQD